jgi:hypothetical protein
MRKNNIKKFNEIKNKLRQCVEKLSTILTPEAYEIIRIHGFISGGLIASIFIGEEPNDVDIFLKQQLSINKIKSMAESARLTNLTCERHVFSSVNALSIDNFQINTRVYGEPKSVIKEFDFEHVKNYYTILSGDLYLDESALFSICTRDLVYTGSTHPISSLSRAFNFVGRGWRIAEEEIIKISKDISRLNLNDPKIAGEQFAGFY